MKLGEVEESPRFGAWIVKWCLGGSTHHRLVLTNGNAVSTDLSELKDAAGEHLVLVQHLDRHVLALLVQLVYLNPQFDLARQLRPSETTNEIKYLHQKPQCRFAALLF